MQPAVAKALVGSFVLGVAVTYFVTSSSSPSDPIVPNVVESNAIRSVEVPIESGQVPENAKITNFTTDVNTASTDSPTHDILVTVLRFVVQLASSFIPPLVAILSFNTSLGNNAEHNLLLHRLWILYALVLVVDFLISPLNYFFPFLAVAKYLFPLCYSKEMMENVISLLHRKHIGFPAAPFVKEPIFILLLAISLFAELFGSYRYLILHLSFIVVLVAIPALDNLYLVISPRYDMPKNKLYYWLLLAMCAPLDYLFQNIWLYHSIKLFMFSWAYTSVGLENFVEQVLRDNVLNRYNHLMFNRGNLVIHLGLVTACIVSSLAYLNVVIYFLITAVTIAAYVALPKVYSAGVRTKVYVAIAYLAMLDEVLSLLEYILPGYPLMKLILIVYLIVDLQGDTVSVHRLVLQQLDIPDVKELTQKLSLVITSRYDMVIVCGLFVVYYILPFSLFYLFTKAVWVLFGCIYPLAVLSRRSQSVASFWSVEFAGLFAVRSTLRYFSSTPGILYGIHTCVLLFLVARNPDTSNTSNASSTTGTVKPTKYVSVSDGEGEDEELEQDTLELSPIDQITGEVMTDPVKGNNCEHPQSFQRSTIIVGKPCPYCKQPVDRLEDDTFLKQWLRKIPPKHKLRYYSTGKVEIVAPTILPDDED